jgi:aspartate aminotransferase
MIRLSKFATLVQPSATLAAGARAKALRDRGETVYDFSLGEPDQDTPKYICDAADAAVRAGQTHYTPAAGTSELRAAVAAWYRRSYGLPVETENVVISNGAKHAIHNALVATVGPGDEVAIPTPAWVSHADLVTMAGAQAVLVPTTPESGFKLTPEQYRAARTPRTRMLMLSSPCNPTGTVYTRGELAALAEAVTETDAAILSDEIYEQLCYGDACPSCVASLRPDLQPRTITVSGASKSYAMTGWRIGWSVAPPHVAKAMADVQSQETGCPSSVAQAAALAALTGPQEAVAAMRAEYEARRDLACRRLSEIPGLRFRPPDGAFYVFFDVSSFFGKSVNGRAISDSASFCSAALEDARVNLVPGSAFFTEGYVRMSFACSRDVIELGLTALGRWLGAVR